MLSTSVLASQGDDQLVALAAGGSAAAFDAIVRRYRTTLVVYCARLLRSDARSEDAVQQTLLSAWRALEAGTEVRELRPWLYRIAHNHAIAMLRSSGFELRELDESVAVAAPEADLERRAVAIQTLASVAALPTLQREALVRTALDGQSYDEAATALGVTRHAVRGLVHRARSSVRAAAAAVVPAPVIACASGPARRSGPLGPWLAELFTGGGSAAGVGVALKSAAIVTTSVAVIGGAVSAGIGMPPHATRARAPARVSAVAQVSTRRISPSDGHVGAPSGPFSGTGGRSPALWGAAISQREVVDSWRPTLRVGPGPASSSVSTTLDRRAPDQSGRSESRPSSPAHSQNPVGTTAPATPATRVTAAATTAFANESAPVNLAAEPTAHRPGTYRPTVTPVTHAPPGRSS